MNENEQDRRKNKGQDSTIVLDIHQALKSVEDEAQSSKACLLIVGGELNGTIFDLLSGEKLIGRSPQNQIPLDFEGISRVHLKVVTSDDGESTTIEDLGSRNGTFVNNQKVSGIYSLHKNDVIKIGHIAFKYIPKNDPERLTLDKLYLKANTDGLTGCYNKMFFINRCEVEVKKSKVTGKPLSLIIFDLDHFKKLNDGFGHDAGDFTLKELSTLIRAQGVRQDDVFARYGGEEFVILLPHTNLKKAYEIAERLRVLVQNHPFVYKNQKLPVTASVGISDYRPGVATGNDLFVRADAAVYESKQKGRNQVNFYKDKSSAVA